LQKADSGKKVNPATTQYAETFISGVETPNKTDGASHLVEILHKLVFQPKRIFFVVKCNDVIVTVASLASVMLA